MTNNANITDEWTPYPAATYHGTDEYGRPTKFYKPEWVDHAERLHQQRKGNSDVLATFELATPNVGIRIVPFDGDAAKIPTRKHKQCVVCDEPFIPIVGRQITCGPRCSRALDKQRRRESHARLKAVK